MVGCQRMSRHQRISRRRQHRWRHHSSSSHRLQRSSRYTAVTSKQPAHPLSRCSCIETPLSVERDKSLCNSWRNRCDPTTYCNASCILRPAASTACLSALQVSENGEPPAAEPDAAVDGAAGRAEPAAEPESHPSQQPQKAAPADEASALRNTAEADAGQQELDAEAEPEPEPEPKLERATATMEEAPSAEAAEAAEEASAESEAAEDSSAAERQSVPAAAEASAPQLDVTTAADAAEQPGPAPTTEAPAKGRDSGVSNGDSSTTSEGSKGDVVTPRRVADSEEDDPSMPGTPDQAGGHQVCP